MLLDNVVKSLAGRGCLKSNDAPIIFEWIRFSNSDHEDALAAGYGEAKNGFWNPRRAGDLLHLSPGNLARAALMAVAASVSDSTIRVIARLQPTRLE